MKYQNIERLKPEKIIELSPLFWYFVIIHDEITAKNFNEKIAGFNMHSYSSIRKMQDSTCLAYGNHEVSLYNNSSTP